MKTKSLWIALVIISTLLLAGCDTRVRVGTVHSESQSVELGEAESVRVAINFGAGDLRLTGGAARLLEADFDYNVARLKPEVSYTHGALIVQQPGNLGLPSLLRITEFRNEWNLRLSNAVPMQLNVDVGGGTSNLQLAGLSLTGLDIKVGAGESTIDLSGAWDRDLDVTIDSGAAGVTVRLPQDVGVRVSVGDGPHLVGAPGLTKDGSVYTNAAYGESEVTLRVTMEAGIGWINLEVEEAATASD